MNLGFPVRLPSECFYGDCPSRDLGPNSGRIVRKGSFRRSSDSKSLARFRCLVCQRSFSQASYSPCFGQKKRRLNAPIYLLLATHSNLSSIARTLRINPKTVVRKLLFLSTQAAQRHESFLNAIEASGALLKHLHFDEMQSFEHTKCKPLSIPLAVDPLKRKILGFGVCSMPANGPLARVAMRKYGPRADDRSAEAHRVLGRLSRVIDPRAEVTTDQNPNYPRWLRRHFPMITHVAEKGRDGCVVGQGELKGGGFDPLFSLNHTAAMIRAHVSRLFRRTWNTTKQPDRLAAHLMIYADYHNNVLTQAD
jgi:transposase-like protein